MDRDALSLVELLSLFFSESRVVNGGGITAGIGQEWSVPVEGAGGDGYTEWVKATAWENIKPQQPVVVVETKHHIDDSIDRSGGGRFILTHKTYRLIRALFLGEVEATNVINGTNTSYRTTDEGYINVIPDGVSSSRKAIPWGRANPGRVKLFEVNGVFYSIHSGTSVTISRTVIFSSGEPSPKKVYPKRIIQWLPFGTLSETFPRKLDYLL